MRFVMRIKVKRMKDKKEAQLLLDHIVDYIREVVGDVVVTSTIVK